MRASSERLAAFLVSATVLVAAVALGIGLGLFGLVGSLAVPAVLAALAVVVHPIVGLIGVIGGIPIEASVMVGGATIGKALAALVAVVWFARSVLRGESFRDVLTSPLFLAVCAFVGFQVLSALWAVVPVEGLGTFVTDALLLSLLVLTAALVRSWEHAEWVARALVVGAGAAALLVVLQFLGGGVNRAGRDIAGGINTTALVLVSVMPFAFLLIRSRTGAWWNVVGAAYVGIAALAVVLTFSRMSFLILPLVILAEAFEIIRSGRGRVLLVGLATVGVFAFVRFVPLDKMVERVESIAPYVQETLYGSSRDTTISERGYHIRVALAIFSDYPVAGAGYENYGPLFLRYQHTVPGSTIYYQSVRNPHGTLWAVLANQGLLGLLMLSLAIAVLARTLWRVRARLRHLGRTSREFLLLRAVALSAAVQVLYMTYSEVNDDKLIWVLFGLAIALSHLTPRRRGARTVRPGRRRAGAPNPGFVERRPRVGRDRGVRTPTGRSVLRGREVTP